MRSHGVLLALLNYVLLLYALGVRADLQEGDFVPTARRGQFYEVKTPFISIDLDGK